MSCKRVILLVAVIILVTGFVFGGGKKESAEPGVITLNHWGPPGFSPDSGLEQVAAVYRELYQEFEARNPGIRINHEVLPGGTEGLQNLLAAAGEGNLPDVGIPDGFWVPRLVARGVLQPLNDLWPEEDRADFQPEVVDAVTIDGQIYALWFYNAWRGIVYRRDMLDAAGFSGVPPTNRDEYIQFAKALSADGRHAVLYPGLNSEVTFLHMLGYFWGYGGRLVDENGRPSFHEGPNRDALRRTFKWYADMINEHRIMPDAMLTMDEGEIREYFYDESVFSITQSSSHLLQIRTDRPDLYEDLILTNYPMESGYRGVPHLVGWTYGIFTDDPARKEAAWKFVEWMNSPENLGRLNEVHGHLPVRRSVSESVTFFRDDPVFSQVLEIVFEGEIRERPGVAIYPVVSESIRTQLGDVVSGVITIDQAIDEAAEVSLEEWRRMEAR